MGDPLPPDPYLALGVAKDATAAAIKTQYRKLVLKFHPDKVTDESQKQAAADQFHKIQTAYEIVSDESRRARYDAQSKLAELRKDVMNRDGGGGGNGRRRSSDDERSPRYPSQPEYGREYSAREPRSARASPPQYQTEERRPDYPSRDYFDAEPPKATSRKDGSADYERSSKRASPKESKTKSSKGSSILGGSKKKADKSSRKEKERKADRDVRQGRQQKFTPTVEEDSESDQDSYTKRFRPEDVDKVRNDYWEHQRRQREQTEKGYFGDERTRKLFTQGSEARDYIGRSGRTPRTEEPETRPPPQRMSSSREYVERRPSPPRMSSSKDGVEFVKRGSEKHPSMMRKGSSRPQTLGRSSERRRESEVVEEPARDRRPPTLNHTKSSPPVVGTDVRQPEKQHRSYSVQMDPPRTEEPPIPKVRRAETMPYKREAAPEKGSSRLRNGYSAYPTPETSPERPSRGGKFDYNRPHAYADDVEYASPDGYEVPASSSRYDTEVRHPTRTTSHSKRDRDRYAEEPVANSRRTSTAKPPPPMPSRSTSYVYPDNGSTPYVRDRPPPPSRENSSRLYGEVRTTSNSPANVRARYSPPAQAESGYSRTLNTDQPLNMQTGYKTSKERPAMHRRDTGRQAVR